MKPNDMNGKTPCPECGAAGIITEIGTASGRAHFKCSACPVTWRGPSPQKNPAAVALGRLGGKARAEALTPEERSEAATNAIDARWRAEKLSQNVLPAGMKRTPRGPFR